MDILKKWVCSIVCYLCFVQVIEQLLPNDSYRKYVRFFCGLLLIILVATPLADLSGLSQKLEDAWRMAALKEEWASLNMEQEGLSQLREQMIHEACREEIERQIAEVAKGNGMDQAQAEVDFETGGTEILNIREVCISGTYTEGNEDAIQEAVLQELSSIYQIGREDVAINIKKTGGDYGE